MIEDEVEKKRKEEMLLPPKHSTLIDWLILNTRDFYSLFQNFFLAEIRKDCTEKTCPRMSAGPTYEYLWAEGACRKNPTHLPAFVYIQRVCLWAEHAIRMLQNSLPTDKRAAYKKTYGVCSRVWGRTIRILMHIYRHHWDFVVQKGLDDFLDQNTKHFVMFALKYKLITRIELINPIVHILLNFLPRHYLVLIADMQAKEIPKNKKARSKTCAVKPKKPALDSKVPFRASSSSLPTKHPSLHHTSYKQRFVSPT